MGDTREMRTFDEVDVFGERPLLGNPLAVVHDADDLTDEQMAELARWTNFSETSFLLRPTDDRADYRVRIFTPILELPFAGHPTLGTCHAWLAAGGTPHDATANEIVQECAAGLVRLRRIDGRLAFEAPPLVRSGPVDDAVVTHVAELLGIDRSAILDAEWVDNGPGWVGILLASADEVVDLRPGVVDQDIGVVGFHPEGSPLAYEVRAFMPYAGATVEDPVTGSLNASLAGWLLRAGRVTAPYVASQGTALRRAGRIHVSDDDDGAIWIGGATDTIVRGEIDV
jgi:PhzF family phenazine biosynthesis protein